MCPHSQLQLVTTLFFFSVKRQSVNVCCPCLFQVAGVGSRDGIEKCVPAIPGCIDETAENFNALATVDGKGCTYPDSIQGQTERNTDSYAAPDDDRGSEAFELSTCA